MRIGSALLAAGLLVLASTPPAFAQRQGCDFLPGARDMTRLATPGGVMIFISGPVEFLCDGGVTVRADSAVQNASRGELQLHGHVLYGDSLKTLTADWLNFLEQDGRLFARGDVVFTDRSSGSTIRGPELEYLRQTPGRRESRTLVRGGAHALLYPRPAPDAPPAEDRAAQGPLEVTSDRLEILGERYFHATGNAHIVRGTSVAWAREARFDDAGGRLLLIGDARVEDPEFELVADYIEAELDGDAIREALATPHAVLTAEDMEIRAPQLRIFFADGEIERLIGFGLDPDAAGARGPVRTNGAVVAQPAPPAPDPGDAEPPRPTVTSPDYRLVADSLDIRAPRQSLEEVIAVGTAFAEWLRPDVAAEGLPEILARDWLRGDTIIGHFVPDTVRAEPDVEPDALAPPDPPDETDGPGPGQAAAAADTAAAPARVRPVLDRIIAIGQEGAKARALYRIDDADNGRPPGANYLIALRITLRMSDGEVAEVEADGPLEGIYLDPVKPPDDPEPDAAPPRRRNSRR